MRKVFSAVGVSLLLLGTKPSPPSQHCTLVTSDAQMEALLQNFETLYFFASWCPVCVPGLRQADTTHTLFIPFRDTLDAATTCLYKYQPQATCVQDPDGTLARRFSVEEIPALRTRQDKPLILKSPSK